MAKKEEPKEVKAKEEQKKEAKKEATEKEEPKEAKKEKKEERKHEARGEAREKREKRGAPKELKKEAPKPKEGEPEIRHIIRIADTDLDGKRSVQYALTGIKGISRRVAKILSVTADLNPQATLGYLKDPEIEKLQSSVDNITSIIPSWMLNKQDEIISGENRHVIGTDVLLSRSEDINLMKKVRSYKGIRHERGLRVRGQRTRSTGRKGRTVGVMRATVAAAAAAAREKEGEKKEEKKEGGK